MNGVPLSNVASWCSSFGGGSPDRGLRCHLVFYLRQKAGNGQKAPEACERCVVVGEGRRKASSGQLATAVGRVFMESFPALGCLANPLPKPKHPLEASHPAKDQWPLPNFNCNKDVAGKKGSVSDDGGEDVICTLPTHEWHHHAEAQWPEAPGPRREALESCGPDVHRVGLGLCGGGGHRLQGRYARPRFGQEKTEACSSWLRGAVMAPEDHGCTQHALQS
ncbi:hypothetical protein J0S82_017417 [Galemys pyrenaicus]|uniref:Uncharacterized protein n=1 Tax=Galemys pyrenaicus TaxID=202257 RepID=A0A8J6AEI6_GALPY|nr:hypothetical protein J0S82_017417 [Galemys pyrenaicus]